MASGRPDWYSSVVIQGRHGDDYVPVGVDTDGNMIARIRGLFGAALKDITVDTDGNMIAVIKGDFGGVSKNVAVDTGGHIIARMQALFGADLQDIKIDDAGNMIAVMKGDFAGALKTLAVDTNGNLKANLVVQDLARVVMRISQGPIEEANLGHTFGGVGEADLIDIAGAGTILGGFLDHDPANDHKGCAFRFTIDGTAFAPMNFASHKNLNYTDMYTQPTRIVRYDNDNFRYTLSFVNGWSFDTNLKFTFYENVGASTVAGRLYYSLIV